MADRLTRFPALPLNGAFKVRRTRDEVYGPFTGKELRLYLDLEDGTAADQVELTEDDATLTDSDYVVSFLMSSTWTGDNLSAGTWEGRLYVDEVYAGGFRFDAVAPAGGDHNP